MSETAAARLARIDVGRAILRDGQIEIAGPYSQRRLPALRDLPERRFDAERQTWMVPLTRAGALALLALADDTNELLTTHRARAALERAATSAAPRQTRPIRRRSRARTGEAITDRPLAPLHLGPGLR